jgi:CheY-like chemotaxis protein
VKTILLADDSITIQKVVELTFSEADYRVVSVSTGGQALKKMAEVRPDIVLLDVIMPEKNGYEVCEQLKRSPATSGIPVLLLTGTFEPFDKKRADAVGANGHITKPFESQALVAKVEELIAARPSVSVDDEGGRMDIISGGEVYRVDPGRAGEGMRPAMPTPDPAPRPSPAQAAPAVSAGVIGSAVGMPLRGSPPADEDPDPDTARHPALAAPDPAAGGSFVGFADVGFGDAMDEGDIVPDRYDADAAPSTPSTAKLRRDEVVQQRKEGSVRPAARAGTAGTAGVADDSFDGSFESHFDLIDEVPPQSPIVPFESRTETGGWAPPPEAPPAETWQDTDTPPQEVLRGRDGPSPAAVPGPAAGPAMPEAPSDGRGASLTPEMIDLIAEKVVERLADRVVREVAWEVVPGVAEALVRKRIKEIEESGS